MKKTILLSSLVGLFAASMPVKATEYIYAGAPALIGSNAYTVEAANETAFLVKYSFPAFEETKRVDLNDSFPNVIGSENGFAVSHITEYEWSSVSEEDRATLKKRGFAAESGSQTLTETTVYTSYSSDLEKVAEKTISNVYVFNNVYEDNPTTLADDGLAGAVDDKFCGKKKSKHGKCKKILLRSH